MRDLVRRLLLVAATVGASSATACVYGSGGYGYSATVPLGYDDCYYYSDPSCGYYNGYGSVTVGGYVGVPYGYPYGHAYGYPHYPHGGYHGGHVHYGGPGYVTGRHGTVRVYPGYHHH